MSITVEREEVLRIEHDPILKSVSIHEAQDEVAMHAFSNIDKLRLKQEILDVYDEIDYKDLDGVNEKRFEKIEDSFRLLHLSDIHFSSNKKDEIKDAFRRLLVSLNAIQRRIKRQLDLLHKDKDWDNLWDFEDEMVYELLDLVCSLQELKLNSVNNDQKLKQIGMRTFAHKYARNLTSQRKNNVNKEPPASCETVQTHHIPISVCRSDRYEVYNGDYLWIFYILKTNEDKTAFRKALLANYLDREKINNSGSSSFSDVVYKFLLRDFQGDLSLIVKNRRKAKGWTQQQLADAVGVERTMITKVEKLNAVSSLETTVKLLASLDLQLMACPLDQSGIISKEEIF